jgi:tetratricopeptide (TPR) repeat protein
VDQEYNTTIKKGDQYYAEEKYDRALYEFETARKLKPNEKYPQERIKVINEILDDQKTKNILFEVAVTSAEKWYKAADYKRAKAEFENALRIDPSAQYPKDRLAQINKIWSDPEVDARYAAAILRADDLFALKSYVNARAEYMVASDLKPFEQYPLDRIIAINEILANLQQLQDQYNGIIARADQQFDKKEYSPARSSYQDASNIKPDEVYPVSRIQEIDVILEKLKAEREVYDRIIAMADEYYLNKEFERAKIEYEKAVEMKPSEAYAKNMIAKIDPQIAEMQRTQGEYDLAMTNANTLMQKKDYEGARAMFQKAGTLKPKEALPKDKMAEIDRILNDMAVQNEQEKQFNGAIRQADSLFALNDLEASKSYFVKASGIFPDQSYPKEKIEEIGSLLAAQKAKEEYSSVIADADRSFAVKDYQKALYGYEKAASILPSEAYPQSKIKEINTLLSDLKALEDSYAQAVQEGDRLFAAADYTGARTSYQKASGIRPAEAYPKTKIAEIDKLLAEIARIQQEYDKAIAAADAYYDKNDLSNARLKYVAASDLKPAEQYPRDRISLIDKTLADKEALEKGYRDTIAQADDFFAKKDYPPAKAAYQQAMELKPSEKHPADRIAEIDRILAGIAASELAYQEAVKAADALFAEKDYPFAISEYQKAQKAKPEETYPGEQIAKINQMVADLKATEEGYKNAIAEADKLFLAKQYEDALVSYRKAMEIKPGETYPQTRIDEINTLLSDLKALEDSYAQAVQEGDRLFAAIDYTGARTSYQKASGIKPVEAYPKTKIAEIDKFLAEIARVQKEYELAVGNADRYFTSKEYTKALAEYQKAQNLKPQETYPPEQIAKINQVLEEIKNLENSYASHISAGDDLLVKKDYSGALDEFRQASALKPEEIYPRSKISEAEAALAALQARQKAYNEAVAKADGFFGSKEYDKAKLAYQEALTHDPGQPYPQDQIGRINELLKDLEIRKSFDAAVAKADQFFDAKDYDNARTEYQKAINLRPSEPYPQKRIEEINSILAANEQARLESYSRAIEAGDSFFALQDYKSAKVQYQNAISINPGQQYPKDRLKEVEKILLDREMELKKAYQDAVAKADNLYSQKILDEAIDAYMTAQEIKNDEVYPLNMINQIKKYIADHAIVDILNSSVIISNNTERKFDFKPVDIRQRKNNYVVMKARVLSETKPKVYLNYGKDATRSGGIVLKSIKDNEVNDYIIRVSAQDPWYRIDNSWLKLYSEGGDIEVTYIQISTAD